MFGGLFKNLDDKIFKQTLVGKEMFDKEKSLIMLRDIKSILDKEKIPFWLEAGTLLGAIKYKKIMPWDTDIDLGAYKRDFSEFKMKRLAKLFEKKGFIVYFFPEKIDFLRDGGVAIQIHLAHGPTKGYFVRQMADNRHKSGKKLFQVYRLTNVSYYGKFKFNNSKLDMKTNLFKIITFLPKIIKKSLSNIVRTKLTKLKDSGVYYIRIPNKSIGILKEVKFYGLKYNVPVGYDNYLWMQYGNWHAPPPKDKSKPWVWHEHGDWKKIYNSKDMVI